jgi:hypothetical protein
MPRKVENVIGKRFGRLVVLEKLNTKSHGSTIHKCICDCGNIKNVPLSYLKSEHTRSCGCLSLEAHTSHGLSRTRLYGIHQSMLKRCFSSNSFAYKDYGGRGITVCDEWKNDFQTFYNWAVNNGYSDELTIDRIDVNGNYEPSNCRWITKGEQSKNTRKNVYFTYNGETKIISDWVRELGIPLTTFRRRIKQNRPIEEILYKGDLKCRKKK